MHPARKMWRETEPYHALAYFAPEVREALEEAGCKGGWMCYFAGRAAPLGAASPELVAATFFNFRPAMVARAVPDCWSLTTPERAVVARRAGMDRALRRALGDDVDSAAIAEAATLARTAAEACTVDGRPLFAAHAALDWPAPSHLALWHALTLLREFRGDGHVVSLVAAGLDGRGALVLHAASGAVPAALAKTRRGWSDDEWAAATSALAERGWLADDGALTPAGRDAKDEIEARTDDLASAPWAALGDDGCARLRTVIAPAVSRIVDSGAVTYPNPMGLPAPDRAINSDR